ncbi:hypothetical protein P175DRAFT_0492817 [Aspergillus ochraceoroseus IBT 24754]|uniref:SAM-dependent methyltransferase n=1 Tax=Aspergillus ochraceoroseus IBT 24754 TaxID=1392256 RepID=A0A2T5LVZ5_9EURO|nr:uncharacterized protein P175DRAFT_0492817 [Aspergillus ochraceoroseus IBT 24754]PTU20460.1 hypothetical protein P175DRAFT_0492817 [Aspergillus ochraceoroseus IBT 24754]
MDISLLSNQISTSPRTFPDCCLAISSILVTRLATLLPSKPAFAISVGSGSGLLEALIAHRHPSIQIEGIEVDLAVNRYLPEESIDTIRGTWDIHSRAAQASAWMFVYPRQPKLVAKYLDTYGDQRVELILWLGPRIDWADYEAYFHQSLFTELSFPADTGLTPYEMLVIARRQHI